MIVVEAALAVAVGSVGCLVLVGNGEATVLVIKTGGRLVAVGEAGGIGVLVGKIGWLVAVDDMVATGVLVCNVAGGLVTVGALRVGEAGTSVAVGEAA